MTTAEPLTLYTAKVCPYAQRTEIALAEAQAPYTRYEIDLQNKPEWYAPQVNPASKVPAIAYGGPKVPADTPSPQSTKLAESLILVEFIADLFPSAHLLPADPVTRAKARFFIDTFSNKFSPAYFGFQARGDSPEALYKAIETLQGLLAGEGKWAVGDEFSIADVAIAPFLARLEVALSNDLGGFEVGEGKKVWETLQTDEKYGPLRSYWARLKERKSVKDTFYADHVLALFNKRLATWRAPK
ncbi:glutathione S-transferase [Armillaria gallica]|uniref:Glutathione S-transferase n=1 Tax=Armillaria gallica TaxID=47427 RepID=A0A2H3CYX6_ARMGA|nr:glutathione S-transferase [Armillaria gallica]